MIYNSQHINNDPEPWQGYDLSRKSRRSAFACLHRPRPWFDNDPNPILQDFREHAGSTREWLELLGAPSAWEFLADTEDAYGVEITRSHIEHAIKVLTRLDYLLNKEQQ